MEMTGVGRAQAPRTRGLWQGYATRLGLCLAALSLMPGGAEANEGIRPGQAVQVPATEERLAPYVPTPHDVVDRMLELAGVTSRDVVYDLGCGDGRLVIRAASRFGARGVGVDIDPARIAESRTNAARAGVGHLVSFLQQDAVQTDVSEATVVLLYLLTSSNMKLRPILTRQLRPGARIVSHAFGMGDWEPDRIEDFTDGRGTTRRLYLWKADGRVRP